MCLIVFAYNQHPEYKLILAANRDESYRRPTAPAGWWDDHPEILGGRDLEAQGTWMAISKTGKFAAVTNYRDLANIRSDARSRGELPTNFLLSNTTASNYAKRVQEKGKDYNGFNLLVLDQEMVYAGNYAHEAKTLSPGIYGLSNALLDSPWTKVEKAKADFQQIISRSFESQQLLDMMTDQSLAPDQELPETGLDYAREKALSAMCIRTPDYGTCCTTVVTIRHSGEVTFAERSYPVGDRKDQLLTFSFNLEK